MDHYASSSIIKYGVTVVAAFAVTNSISGCHGHGYMLQPPSRNYWSNLNGKDYGLESGVPIPREYCFHCLNTNTGVCGTSEQGVNYDEWVDSLNQPMPWITSETYQVGDIITVGMELKSHHLGHMELRGCPVTGDDNGRSTATQDCFDEHVLEFVEDISYQMPKDEDHPERGYFYGGSSFNNELFTMRFKLPSSLSGEKVLLQWFYYTANSCSPVGYYDYFAIKNTNLPSTFWGGLNLSTCSQEQFPARDKDFFTGDSPERFVNCAEVSIVGDGSGGNNNLRPPTNVPVVVPLTNAPVVGVTPTNSPVDNNVFNPSPANSPVVDDTPNENENDNDNSTDDACCSIDYKTCATWCNESKEFCENNASCITMKWLPNGSLVNSDDPNEQSCAARWAGCDSNNDCCDGGLECRFINEYFSQCLYPTDP